MEPQKCFTTFNHNNKFDTVCGPAFTSNGRVTKGEDPMRYDSVRIEMLKSMPEGVVHVLGQSFPGVRQKAHDPDIAHFGDITANTLRSVGCKGSVIHGTTRDIREIEDMKYPICYDGVTPLDAIGYWNLTDYGERTYVGMIGIDPGDIIHMSGDGIIVISKHVDLNTVLKLAQERFDHEERVRHAIAQGKSVQEIYETEGRW